MVRLVRWLRFTRFGAAPRAPDEDLGLFDRIDAHGLQVGEFRACGSMHFADPPASDFSDTLPAYCRDTRPFQTAPSPHA
jgi:hypothetical protein